MLLDIETMTTFNCVTSYGIMEPPLCLSGLLNDWWLAFGCTYSTTAWTVKSRAKSYIHSMYIVSLDCIEFWKQRPFFFSPKEMKCVVKFSCSLVGGTSSFQLLFLLVLLLFVSHLLEAIPVASILSLSSIHSSLQCAPGKPQQPPPLEPLPRG